MKKLILGLVLIFPLVSCNGDPGAPIGIACSVCDMLDQVGICDMIQVKPFLVEPESVPECTENETLFITNVKEVFEGKEKIKLECVENGS